MQNLAGEESSRALLRILGCTEPKIHLCVFGHWTPSIFSLVLPQVSSLWCCRVVFALMYASCLCACMSVCLLVCLCYLVWLFWVGLELRRLFSVRCVTVLMFACAYVAIVCLVVSLVKSFFEAVTKRRRRALWQVALLGTSHLRSCPPSPFAGSNGRIFEGGLQAATPIRKYQLLGRARTQCLTIFL